MNSKVHNNERCKDSLTRHSAVIIIAGTVFIAKI